MSDERKCVFILFECPKTTIETFWNGHSNGIKRERLKSSFIMNREEKWFNSNSSFPVAMQRARFPPIPRENSLGGIESEQITYYTHAIAGTKIIENDTLTHRARTLRDANADDKNNTRKPVLSSSTNIAILGCSSREMLTDNRKLKIESRSASLVCPFRDSVVRPLVHFLAYLPVSLPACLLARAVFVHSSVMLCWGAWVNRLLFSAVSTN